MLSFDDLQKAAAKKQRQERIQRFKEHPLTKIGTAAVITVASRILADAVMDKLEERKERKQETIAE